MGQNARQESPFTPLQTFNIAFLHTPGSRIFRVKREGTFHGKNGRAQIEHGLCQKPFP